MKSLKSRSIAAACAATAVVLAVVAVRHLSAPESTGGPVPQSTASGPRATAARNTATAADWLERIRNTPAIGRAGLMREILALHDEALRNEIATALAMEWMSSDIDGYLTFLDSLMVEDGLNSETMKRFSVAMMRSFETVSNKQELKGKIRYVAEVITNFLIATDIGRAEGWAREYLVGLDLDIALGKIAPAMVETSPEKAIEIFSSIKSASPRLTAAAELGTALARKDPAAAIRWANSITANSERTLAMAGVSVAMAAEDPGLAASSLKAFLEKIQKEYTETRERDREQAGVKPADEFQTPELYQEYLDANGYVLMQPDTPEADYLLQAAERIAYQLGKTDPAAAIAWAEALAVGIAQAHAISGALTGWSLVAPEAAVSYYIEHYGYDAGMPLALFENWAGKDPLAAAAALDNLTSPAQKSSAILGITNGWLENGSDYPALVDWVADLPTIVDRDAANMAIISSTSDTNPASAWDLVMEISDPAIRTRAAEDVFSILAIENAAAARAALQNYQAPADEIATLQGILKVAESPK